MINIRSSLPEVPVETAAGTIPCYMAGRGRLNFILLHGLNSYSGTWKKNVGMFESLGRVCAPTLPRTPMPRNGDWREPLDALTSSVSALMEAVNFTPAVIVGNSMGGAIGMRLASTRPEMVSALVLVDSAIAQRRSGGSGQDADPPMPGTKLERMPVLIVWGEEDRVIPLSRGRELHAMLHGSRMEVIAGCGHIPHLEKPDIFNALVMEFVKDSLVA